MVSVDGGAVEGDVASWDGCELDGVLDPAHEDGEVGRGLADACVVDAHEAPAARRVVRVRAAVAPAAAEAAVLRRLQLVGRGGGVAAVQRQRPRRGGDGAQAARLVGQVELRPAEHLRRGEVLACHEHQQQQQQQGGGPLHGLVVSLFRIGAALLRETVGALLLKFVWGRGVISERRMILAPFADGLNTEFEASLGGNLLTSAAELVEVS
jgi:hypothetical protein